MAPRPPPECPPGHRVLELADIVVGRQVTYVSREGLIRTTIVNGHLQHGDALVLKCKNLALRNRVFVPLTSQPPSPSAVGNDKEGRTSAAIGAGSPKGPKGPAAATAAVGTGSPAVVEGASAVGEEDEANDFLQNKVAPWMDRLQSTAVSGGKSLADALADALTDGVGAMDPEEVVQAFKSKVPWGTGYVGFQVVPRSSKRGSIHISMLSFDKTSYSANGMFLNDASLLLKTQGMEGLLSKTLAVRPRPGARMTVLGWEPDGAVVNSTYAFACSCIAAYAVLAKVDLPQPLARCLSNISVSYTKQENSQDRLLQNLVDSAVQRHANRTVQCPVFLAEELGRCTIQPGMVKPFVKLYQKRMSVSPGLQMPQRMEDCVIRLMSPNKTCPKALAMLRQSVINYSWHDGPWQVSHLLASNFPIGAPLNTSMVVEWSTLNVQTAVGQTLALEIGGEIFGKTGRRLDSDEWTTLLVACGFWTTAKETLLPSLMMGPAAVGALDALLRTDENFRKDLAAASAKDPPVSAVGDLAGWLLQQVSELKRQKQRSVEAARQAANMCPSKLLGDADARELAAYNYSSGCMLDVQSYRQAVEKCGEEFEELEAQWRDLQAKFAANLQRMHDTLQQSDVVYWEPVQRPGVKSNKDWLAKAVTACNQHRRNLKTIIGVKDSDICQINVFSLYSLGTVKRNALDAIARSLDQLPGISIVFYPVIPKRLKRKTVESAEAAVGATADRDDDDQSAGSADSDVDEEEHDFTAEGALPEALTSLHTVKTAAQRSAQLAADCHEVDRAVGMSDIEKRYPKYLHFLHTADATGEKATTMAMLLLPTDVAAGVDMTTLGESTAMRVGSYTDVPLPTEWISVSKKLAQQARRAIAERGVFELSESAAAVGARYVGSRISKGQLGVGLHEVWLRDIVKACGTKVLYVCDFAHGAGEVAKAVISTKVSGEAAAAGVRVCLWAQDPRKIFAEIGRAVGRTELSNLFSAKRLSVPGHQPLADPGERPERTRKLIKAMLPTPLKTLSLDKEGNLIVPTEEEISKACPVSLTAEQLCHFQKWRVEFPRPSAEVPPGAPAPAPAPNGGSSAAVSPGKVVEDVGQLKELGEEIVVEVELPGAAGTAMSDIKLALGRSSMAAVGAGTVVSHVWLHNTSTKKL